MNDFSYYVSGNPAIWDNIVIDSRLDKTILTTTLESDWWKAKPLLQDGDLLKRGIEVFFQRWKYQIGKLLDTQEFEYNPIWNKDGTITEKRNVERDREEQRTDDVRGNSTSSAHATNLENESPANTDAYHAKIQNISDSSGTAESNTDSRGNTNENESTAETLTRTETGNIGITSTQELITAEQKLYWFNIYHWISERFGCELFALVF